MTDFLSRPLTRFSRETRVAALLFVVALLVRIVYLGEQARQPWFAAPLLDARAWLYHAGQLVGGNLGLNSYFRPPFYTLLLAGMLRLFGDSAYFVTLLLQHILGAGLCVMLYYIGARCWSFGAGLAAGIMAVGYAPFPYFEGELLNDIVAVFFSTAFLLAWLRAVQTGRRRDFLLSGAWAGLAAVTRPTIVLTLTVFVFVSTGLLISRRLRASLAELQQPTLTFKSLCVFLAPFVVIVAIPCAHTAALGDLNLICSQGGINFYVGNNGHANGLNPVFYYSVEGTGEYRDAVEEFGILGYLVAKHGEREGLHRYHKDRSHPPRPSVLSSYWYVRGLEDLASDLPRALRLYAKKCIALVNNYEVRNNKDFYFMRKHFSPILQAIPFTFGWIFAPALAGAVVLLRDRENRSAKWLLLYLAASAASVVAFLISDRLRLPVIPALLVLGGIGLDQLAHATAARRWPEVSNLAGFTVLGAAVSFYYWPQVDFRANEWEPPGVGIYAASRYGETYALLASGCLDAGHFDAALLNARKAVELEPDYVFANTLAGTAALQLGDTAAAANYYHHALMSDPSVSSAITNLGAILERRGDLQAATETWQHAIIVNPYDAPALGNLAIVHARAGDKDGARSFAQRALTVNPNLMTAQAVADFLEPNPAVARKLSSHPGLAKVQDELRSPLPSPINFNARRSLPELIGLAK